MGQQESPCRCRVFLRRKKSRSASPKRQQDIAQPPHLISYEIGERNLAIVSPPLWTIRSRDEAVSAIEAPQRCGEDFDDIARCMHLAADCDGPSRVEIPLQIMCDVLTQEFRLEEIPLTLCRCNECIDECLCLRSPSWILYCAPTTHLASPLQVSPCGGWHGSSPSSIIFIQCYPHAHQSLLPFAISPVLHDSS